MKKPDLIYHAYPLDIVVPVSKLVGKVPCLYPEPLWHDKDREYCICRKNFQGVMFGCERCHEWYHSACLGFKKKAEKAALAEANDWLCGYCKSEADEYGDVVWVGKIGNSAFVVKKQNWLAILRVHLTI